MAIDLIELTQRLITDLDKDDIYLTEVYVAYKVILYYENNIGEISNKVKPKLIEIINDIYNTYLKIDDPENLDYLVSDKINNLK